MPDRHRTDVGRTFLRLGLTSFGGPVAHLGYFRTEVVGRRNWLSDAQYADLVALGQFLPGPASSQVGMGVGLLRAGVPGSLRAWLGFTLPSAVLMIGAGLAVGTGVRLPSGVLEGLLAATVAVVGQAVLVMARALCRGWLLALVALAAGVAVLAVPTVWMPSLSLVAAGLVGLGLVRHTGEPSAGEQGEVAVPRVPPWVPRASLVAFLVLLVGLPLVAQAWPGEWTSLIAGFFRAGALVFGGGHVVLPMLEQVVVGSGAVPAGEFLAGYGLANALPGPLFTFAGYLGAVAGGAALGVACLVAVFLPGWLLVLAALGHWHRVRGDRRMRRALVTVNAAVVGLLGAALVDPVVREGITGWPQALIAGAALVALVRWQVAPHLVVLACAAAGVVALG